MAEKAQAHHVVVLKFAGQDRARQVIDLIRDNEKDAGVKVKAWVVAEVDEKGKVHVKQTGHGAWGTAMGAGGGVLLGLIGGPAGLLIWALAGGMLGGLAGKYLGRDFDEDAIKELASNMEPNTSAVLAIVEDEYVEKVENAMGNYDADITTFTFGDQLTGELESVTAVDLGEVGEGETQD
jgi:uncharacterized membrane protein